MKNRIRELRAEKNITQLRLSMELEVSQETVSAYENGKHLPSLKSLIKMADLFHVSTDYLIGRSDIRNVSQDEALPNEDIALLDCFHDLDTVQSAKHGLLPMHRDFLTRLQKTEKLAAKKYTSYLPEHPTKWRVFFVVHFTEILLKSGVPIRSNGVLW